MAVPEAHGGWGASLLDLALVAELVGRARRAGAGARGPGGRAPARGGRLAAAARRARAGARRRAARVRGGPPAGRRRGRRSSRPAPCATPLVVLDGDALRLVPVADADRTVVANLASAPLADVRLARRASVLAEGPEAGRARSRSRSTSGSPSPPPPLVGSGTAALEIGCEYAIERRAFGSPIGVVPGRSRTRWPTTPPTSTAPASSSSKAAWELDRAGHRGRELAAMAFAFASDRGREGHLRRAPHPRRLRLHARVRRAAALAAGPGLAPRVGRRRRRLPPGGADARLRERSDG